MKHVRAVGEVQLWTLSCVYVRVHMSSPLLQVQRSSVSLSHSPIEIQVSHVFGRFLRSTHFLIIEDHPPEGQRDHYRLWNLLFSLQKVLLNKQALFWKYNVHHLVKSDNCTHTSNFFFFFEMWPQYYKQVYPVQGLHISNFNCSDQTWSMLPPADLL